MLLYGLCKNLLKGHSLPTSVLEFLYYTIHTKFVNLLNEDFKLDFNKTNLLQV